MSYSFSELKKSANNGHISDMPYSAYVNSMKAGNDFTFDEIKKMVGIINNDTFNYGVARFHTFNLRRMEEIEYVEEKFMPIIVTICKNQTVTPAFFNHCLKDTDNKQIVAALIKYQDMSFTDMYAFVDHYVENNIVESAKETTKEKLYANIKEYQVKEYVAPVKEDDEHPVTMDELQQLKLKLSTSLPDPDDTKNDPKEYHITETPEPKVVVPAPAPVVESPKDDVVETAISAAMPEKLKEYYDILNNFENGIYTIPEIKNFIKDASSLTREEQEIIIHIIPQQMMIDYCKLFDKDILETRLTSEELVESVIMAGYDYSITEYISENNASNLFVARHMDQIDWNVLVQKDISQAAKMLQKAASFDYEPYKFINLTPHVINIYDATETKIIRSIEPEKFSARIMNKSTSLVATSKGVSIVKTDGETFNLPEPKEGVLYIVSQLTACEVLDRHDLVFPYISVHDNNGSIIGCRSLRLPNRS